VRNYEAKLAAGQCCFLWDVQAAPNGAKTKQGKSPIQLPGENGKIFWDTEEIVL
jgi:hypothetical protein